MPTGSYLVFTGKTPISDDETAAFVNETPPTKPADIIVDKIGGVTAVNITAVKDASITVSLKGKPKIIQKSLLVFMIRKDGTHQLFADPDKATGYLINAKQKFINLPGGQQVPPRQ